MRLLLLLALSGLSASTLASSVLSEPRYPPGHILYHATKPANKKAPTLPSEAPHMYTGGDILDHINDIKKSVNTACPVDQDAVREMEKIFFDYSQSHRWPLLTTLSNSHPCCFSCHCVTGR